MVFACKAEKAAEPAKPAPVIVIKPERPVLTSEQRKELGFPADIISQIESAAAAEAEPFYAADETGRLSGFSVRTKRAEVVIETYRGKLLAKGYLLFKSHNGFGNLPDIVTVTKGQDSYDILKIQRTEGPKYHLKTDAIISWLTERQKDASFVVTGAGHYWVEAQFVKMPQNIDEFAKKVSAFAPDVLVRGPGTQEKLVERMKKTNGFFLVWD